MKGQVAFESLFLLLIVLTATIAITAVYFQTHQDTIAMSTARIETLNQLSTTKENVIIESIALEKTLTTAKIKIKLTPKVELDIIAIKNKVEASTNLKNVIITIE